MFVYTLKCEISFNVIEAGLFDQHVANTNGK